MLTSAEFWLLDVAVTMAIDLPVLVSPSIEVALNRPGHGLSRPALVETIVSLFERGLIKGMREDAETPLDAPRVEAGLKGRAPRFEVATYYYLTQAGGGEWEALLRPNWAMFSEGWDLDGETVVEAGTLELAREIFFDPNGDSVPVAGARAREERLAPWTATYWKELPEGFRVCGPVVPVPLTARTLEARRARKNRAWYSPPTLPWMRDIGE